MLVGPGGDRDAAEGGSCRTFIEKRREVVGTISGWGVRSWGGSDLELHGSQCYWVGVVWCFFAIQYSQINTGEGESKLSPWARQGPGACIKKMIKKKKSN